MPGSVDHSRDTVLGKIRLLVCHLPYFLLANFSETKGQVLYVHTNSEFYILGECTAPGRNLIGGYLLNKEAFREHLPRKFSFV